MFPSFKKTCKFLTYRPMSFCFVAEYDEISNLKLFEDIIKILEVIESEVSDIKIHIEIIRR
jgi:hypothetical protein